MTKLIGTKPNQVPVNGLLGSAAFVDKDQLVDANTDKTHGGFWADETPEGIIWRFRDRFFVGDACDFDGYWGGTVNNYAPLPRWLSREAELLSQASVGRIAISGMSKSSSGVTDPGSGFKMPSIGICGAAVNDYTGTDERNSWGGYFESWREASVPGAVFGVEIDAGNDGADQTNQDPYYVFGSGVYGLTVAAGGSKGAAYTNPSTAGIIIANNTQTFNKGIVVDAEAITGTDGVTGTGTAIALAKGHLLSWYASDGLSSFIYSAVSAAANRVSMVLDNNIFKFFGAGSNILATVENVASSVNYLRFLPGTTGNPAEIRAGGETDVDLLLAPKGAGNVKFGTHGATGDVVITGYITIKDASGTTRKLAVIA